jgi:hypothetical protein
LPKVLAGRATVIQGAPARPTLVLRVRVRFVSEMTQQREKLVSKSSRVAANVPNFRTLGDVFYAIASAPACQAGDHRIEDTCLVSRSFAQSAMVVGLNQAAAIKKSFLSATSANAATIRIDNQAYPNIVKTSNIYSGVPR